MGATGFAYDLARHFGLKVVEPRPALVPLTLGGDEALFRDLSGVAAPRSSRGAGKTALRARPPCSPIAACPARRSCKFPPTGGTAEPIGDRLPAGRSAGWLIEAKRAQPRATSTRRSASRPARPARRGAGRAARRCRASSPTARQDAARRRTAAGRLALHARTAPKASPRPRSPSAASAPPSCPRRRWKRARCPASTRSARRSM